MTKTKHFIYGNDADYNSLIFCPIAKEPCGYNCMFCNEASRETEDDETNINYVCALLEAARGLVALPTVVKMHAIQLSEELNAIIPADYTTELTDIDNTLHMVAEVIETK